MIAPPSAPTSRRSSLPGCGRPAAREVVPVTAQPPYETLDPEDWDALRRLAHRAIDDGFDHLQFVRDRPVWRQAPPEVLARLQVPVPRDPQGAETAYADFRDIVLAYPM